MKKYILLVTAIVLSVALLMCPAVNAAYIDAERECSITLKYTKGEKSFEGLEIALYKIASLTEAGELEKVSPFDSYPVTVNGVTSQSEWKDIGATLFGYVQAYAPDPCKKGVTNADGEIKFSELETGLYFVGRVTTEADGKIYTFFDTIIHLPAPEGEEYVYDLLVRPKSKEEEKGKKEYTVTKLWSDNESASRPESVTVDIMNNGSIVETAVLSAENNWTYSFSADEGVWSVAEKNVPNGYSVKIIEREYTFIVVNTGDENVPPSDDVPPKDPSENAPQTGEALPPESIAVLLVAAGMIFIILGVGARRKENESQK